MNLFDNFSIFRRKPSLCIDVGGTTINAALISKRPGLLELQKTPLLTIRTTGWLNSSLPGLPFEPPVNAIAGDGFVNAGSIFLCGPFVLTQGNDKILKDDYYVKNHKVPINTPELITKSTGITCRLFNDAAAWLSGAIYYLELINEAPEFPVMALSLGTGVGLAYAERKGEVQELNIGKKFYGGDFNRLSNVAGYWKNPGSGKVHNILGYPFFEWVRNKRRDWDSSTVKSEYSHRLKALLWDLHHQKRFPLNRVKTVVVCGGSTDYVNRELLQANSLMNFHVLTKESLSVAPGLIPLLGMAGN